MTKTFNIVPPQPRRYLIKRRIRMQRFQNAMVLSGCILAGYALLAFAFGAIEPVSWLAPALLILTGVCAAFTIYYARTEAPTQVEVLEYPDESASRIIH